MNVLNWREFLPGVYSAGQPAGNLWSAIRAAGVGSVLNLRPDGEQAGVGEASLVEAAGMRYVHLPIASAASLDSDRVDALAAHLSRPREAGLLVHCGSGNRVGALVALWAHRHLHASPAEALEIGRRAGLAGLEPTVLQLIRDMPQSSTRPEPE